MTTEQTTELPFGSWPSPISADLVAAGGVGIGGAAVHGAHTWWSELRPAEGGRSVLVSSDDSGARVDRLAPPWSARTRVHEYGGGAWWLGRDNLYFAEWSDQRLYRLAIGSIDNTDNTGDAGGSGTDGADQSTEPIPVTPEPAVAAGWRYADGREHPEGEWLVCVREDHHGIGEGGKTEPANEIVGIALHANGTIGDTVSLVSNADFVSSPRFSADGRWLSWVQWNHPNMPWETTTLCAAPVFANMRVGNVQVVAGAPIGDDAGTPVGRGESIHGAEWTNDGRLVFSTDRNGFWNLHSWSPGLSDSTALTDLVDAEIGGPPWVFGVRRWTELEDGRFVVAVTTNAVDSLHVLAASSNGEQLPTLTPIATPGMTSVSGLSSAGPNQVVLVVAGPASSSAVVKADIATGSAVFVRPSEDTGVDQRWFSTAQAVSYDSEGRTAHAFFYPPTGVGHSGLPGTLPPLIVMGHGGPTAHAGSSLNLKVQYWTSRGFAVVDVNYGGSSGFGRAYRDLLQGAWGIVDVEDCINATRHLADAGWVDGDRLAIRGGSAGGFTVLAALVQSDAFAAGTSLYGVADLTALASDTHKFESRYLDGLVGPYPAQRKLYEERSPINHTDQLTSPLLVLQGLEDEIVPPNQSEAIVAALAAKGVPHAYVPFEGEQHGFRKAENIVRSLEVELWFYGKILGFTPADAIEPVDGAVGLD